MVQGAVHQGQQAASGPARAQTLARLQAHAGALAFGAAPIGNLFIAMSDAQAQDTLSAAWEGGIRYFDTAPHYGFGLSESRLGAFLGGQERASFALSTKVGRTLVPTKDTRQTRHGFVDAFAFEPVFDYSYDAIMAGFEQSLSRLQIERVDALFVHDLGAATHGAEAAAAHWQVFAQSGWRAVEQLRAQGLAGLVGLGANETAVCDQAMAQFDVDIFLLAGRYTLLDQQGAGLLDRCAQRGIGVVIGGPFNSGILARGPDGPAHFDYGPVPDAIRERTRTLADLARQHGTSLISAALAFANAHPSVCAVLAGFASRREVAASLAGAALPPSQAFWQDLRANALLVEGASTPHAE